MLVVSRCGEWMEGGKYLCVVLHAGCDDGVDLEFALVYCRHFECGGGLSKARVGVVGGLDGTGVLVQVDVAGACSRAGCESRRMGGLCARCSGQLFSELELVWSCGVAGADDAGNAAW